MVNFGKHLKVSKYVICTYTCFIHMFKDNVPIQIYLIHSLQYFAASSTQFY